LNQKRGTKKKLQRPVHGKGKPLEEKRYNSARAAEEKRSRGEKREKVKGKLTSTGEREDQALCG